MAEQLVIFLDLLHNGALESKLNQVLITKPNDHSNFNTVN